MQFTFGLLLSRKIILIRHCSGRQEDLNPVFSDRISCGYIGCNIANWMEFMWWNNQPSLYSRNFDSSRDYVLGVLEIRNPALYMGDQKFWTSPVYLGGEKFWILSFVFVGDQKFRILSCDLKFWNLSSVLWRIRSSESSPALFGGSGILNCLAFSVEEPLKTRNCETHLVDSYAS